LSTLSSLAEAVVGDAQVVLVIKVVAVAVEAEF
jgi:hypothetical protein